MSITSIIKGGLSTPFSGIKYLQNGARSTAKVFGKRILQTGGAIIGATYAHHHVGSEHGAGITALFAATSAIPPADFILNKVLMAKVGLDNNYYKQQGRASSSFTTNKINDKFGTISHMRQESHRRLIRDRNNINRALNNEAMHFHWR